MNKSACISFWSVDAIITLCKGNIYEALTPELISRLSAFVDSYILFDKVHIKSDYQKESLIEYLGGNDVFDFINSNALVHSDDASKGITVDIDIAIRFTELSKEDKYWSIQHDPEFETQYETIHEEITRDFFMTKLRLWHWCLLNEISKKYSATAIVPNSLGGIESFTKAESFNKDVVHKTFYEFSQFWSNGIISASKLAEDPYLDTISSFPPFLAVLLDRSRDRTHILDNLKTMRKEYQELREIRKNYSNSICNAKTVGEKRDIINSWNESWEHLLSNEFKRSGLLSKDVSASDVVQLIAGATDVSKIIQFLSKNILETHSDLNKTKQFKIYQKISKDADSVYFDNIDLYKKFGIQKILC